MVWLIVAPDTEIPGRRAADCAKPEAARAFVFNTKYDGRNTAARKSAARAGTGIRIEN